jgi:hypothetical protein
MTKKIPVKVIGQIIVALLGLIGTALGVWSQVKTESTNSVVKVTVDRLDEKIIPSIQNTLNEIRKENRVLVDNLGMVRERVAKIEGKLEERRFHVRRHSGGRRPASVESTGPPSPEEVAGKELEKLIMKDAAKEKEIPKMDFHQIQKQAQEGL